MFLFSVMKEMPIWNWRTNLSEILDSLFSPTFTGSGGLRLKGHITAIFSHLVSTLETLTNKSKVSETLDFLINRNVALSSGKPGTKYNVWAIKILQHSTIYCPYKSPTSKRLLDKSNRARYEEWIKTTSVMYVLHTMWYCWLLDF